MYEVASFCVQSNDRILETAVGTPPNTNGLAIFPDIHSRIMSTLFKPHTMKV